MKAIIKEKKIKKENDLQYKVGTLYIQKTTCTVVLCDRDDDCHLRGICIIPGDGCEYGTWISHFIGEYRADWSNSFIKFEGEIILEEEV